MKVVQQTIASLGSPIWIEPLERSYGTAAVIARWRHLNGRLRISTADAIRVCLSLSTGQQVRHAERDRSLSKSVLAGDVIVLRPGIPTETTLEGDAEVVQIFIEPESLGLVHHLRGNPIWPFMRNSSFGCLVFDSLIAVWFLAGAPHLVTRRAARRPVAAVEAQSR